MTRKKKREYNGGMWTEGRFNSFVTSILRSGSRRWAPKYTTLNAAKTAKKINPSSGRLAQHFACAICKGDFPAKQIQIDHIIPIGYDKTWDEFINGLYCEANNLQAICVSCHKIKSLSEKKKKKEQE